jgi:hypothetical protein
MDDGIYLLIARNVPRNPWFPQDMPLFFEGLYGSDLASTEHPFPLTSYLLALYASVGGFSEAHLHLGFLVFPLLLACSMYSISSQVTRHPIPATLTLLALPVVSVMSHTLMTDIPLLALWVASMASFRRGVSAESTPRIWIGASVAAIACLVSYSGLCLAALLALYGILRRNRSAAAVGLLVPIVILGLWITLNYLHYHRLTPELLFDAYFIVRSVVSPDMLAEKSVYAILALGGFTISPLLLVMLGRKRITVAAGILGVLAAVVMLHYGPVQKTLFVIFFVAGTVLVIHVGRTMVRSFADLQDHHEKASDDLFLSLWFLGMLFFCVIVYMTGSARYLLPAVPPLVLIFCRFLESAVNERWLRRLFVVNFVLSGVVAFFLSVADYQFAETYREFSSILQRSCPTQVKNLWFTGEWGFRAYNERAGGKELGRRDARPKPGDLLVIPTLATPYQTLYGETLDLESIAMAAPSRLTFDIPQVPSDSILVCTVGMPFHDKSDGMEFAVHFVSQEKEHALYRTCILPAEGRRWRIHEIPLNGIAGTSGSIVLAANVGSSGNADADWVALARARISRRTRDGETVLYDLYEHLGGARIESAPGAQYHTRGNLPVLPMRISLEQEPVTRMLASYQFRPAFPLRMLDEHAHAGFWSSAWGLLPFSISTDRSNFESISVHEVIREVDAYRESISSWYKQ